MFAMALHTKKSPAIRLGFLLGVDGAGERNRTLDLLITSELLYQLSYTGVGGPGRAQGLHCNEKRRFFPACMRVIPGVRPSRNAAWLPSRPGAPRAGRARIHPSRNSR